MCGAQATTTTGRPRPLKTWAPLLLNYRAEPFDATAAFGRNAPLILEIGFSMGEATAHRPCAARRQFLVLRSA